MADEEEEAKKKEMQQLLSGFLQLKTRKDSEKTSLNELKVDMQWRELMRTARSKELQEDLRLLKESFIKAVDIKDAVIANLEKQIEEIEVQNMWTACGHMRSLEELLAAEELRSRRLKDKYIEELSHLQDSFCEVHKQLEQKFSSETAHFTDLDYIEDTVFKDTELKAKMSFSIMRNDIITEIEREKENIVAAFDCDIRTIWREFQSTLVKYLEDADTMEKLFVRLKEEYRQSMQDTLQDRKITEELRKSIPQLKAQIEQRESDYKERAEKLLMGQESFYSNITDLKDKMYRTRDQDRLSLTNLVVNSAAAIRHLEKLDVKAGRIMRLYKRCEKMKQEADGAETVLEESSLTPEELEQVEKHFNFNLSDQKMAAEGFKYVGLLQNFWERQNKTVLQNLALKREMSDLELLHMQLKSNVDHFFKQVADNDVQSLQETSSQRKPFVQEATLLVKNMPIHSRTE